MALRVVLDWSNGVTRFAGDTFTHKDTIKSLGPVRWNGTEKVWELRPCSFAREELLLRFPGAIIEEIGSGNASAASTVVVTAVVSPPAQVPPPIAGSVSVSEFLTSAERVLREAFSRPILIYGRLVKVTRQGDRAFVDMVDATDGDARVQAAIWRGLDEIDGALKAVGFELAAELDVMFEADVRIRRQGGHISLSIRRVVPEYTLGKLAARREVTNKRLQSEGLFDRNKRLPFAFLPRRLGLLTSSAGTVIHDFLTPLEEARFGFEVFWFPVQVQGIEAKASIVSGIDALARVPDLDAILIFRGGGSPAELAVFSEYEVARAICLSPVPVLAAIGHQADQSSAQDVSWRAFGVPKDLGHFLAEIVLDLRRRFEDSTLKVELSATNTLQSAEENIRHVNEILLTLFSRVFESREEAFRYLYRALPAATAQLHASCRAALVRLVEPLMALAVRSRENPEARVGRATQAIRLRFQAAVGLAAERLKSRAERTISQGDALYERACNRLRRQRDVASRLEAVLERVGSSVEKLEQRFEDARPEVQLDRGYAIVWELGKERVVSDGRTISENTDVEVQFRDGRRKATIKD